MQENKNASEKNITPARRVQPATKPSPVATRAAGARVAPAPKAATAKPAAMRPAAQPVTKPAANVKPAPKAATAKPAAPMPRPATTAARVAASSRPTPAQSKPAPAQTAPKAATAKPAAMRPAAQAKPVQSAKSSGSDGHINDLKQKLAARKEAVAKRPVKAADENPSAEGGFAASVKNNAKKYAVAAFALIFAVIVVWIMVARGCADSALAGTPFEAQYKVITKVGYEADYKGTVKRNIPAETRDEGLESGYPTFGYTLRDVLGIGDDKVAMRNALIAEANYLCSVNTANAGGGGGYNRMDAEGYLYMNDEPARYASGEHRKLYKHTSATGMYLGDVSDDEPAVIKEITMKKRGYNGYAVTGLYAPAGEVIKVQISEKDMEATGGIVVHIGQALYNGQANNIWAAKNAMNRFPVILNTMVINKSLATLSDGVYTAYVGSFVGGPIYVRNTNAPQFSVTISGGVKYPHFILGYTTPEDYADSKKSSAPYFDLEVWDYGVLHSGPRKYADAFTYDQLYDAAILWDKISLVSTQVSSQGIVFLYDSFVAAGGAVAFPGRRSVNCPMDWMRGSLHYQSFVNSGSWGNVHEYNHNFQGWGLGNGGEVTNNALSLVEYSLFTRISSSRKLGMAGDGMGGWNRYTSAPWALDQITAKHFSNGRRGLANYAVMLHSFGQEAFIRAVKSSGGQSIDKWYNACVKATQYDMTHFFTEVCGHAVSDAAVEAVREKNYPAFVPVSSIYQTGGSYIYNGEREYFTTMQPYVIAFGKDYELDLGRYKTTGGVNAAGMYESGSIVLPNGFSYNIKNISAPEHGSIRKSGENKYIYTPDENNLRSGKIYVTIEITKDDGAFEVDDVELVFEFVQSHELNKTVLEHTIYDYTQDEYQTATEAYEAGYAGYTQKQSGDHANPINPNNNKVVQNSNAEVWYIDKISADGAYEQDGVVDEGVVAQAIELRGKLYAEEAAKYRISVRGRSTVALYVSLDGGKNYEKAAWYESTNSAFVGFPVNVDGGYKDYELPAQSWVYFKAVLLRRPQEPRGAFVGVGWGKFVPSTGIFDENGELIGETPETVSVDYANAYRSSYEFDSSEFETEYFYTRKYAYNYSDVRQYGDKQKVVSSNYVPWDNNNELFNINNLFDGNPQTNIHFGQKFGVSASNPGILNVDMGETVKVNSMTLYGYTASNSNNIGMPRDFVLQGSLNGEEFFEVGKFTDCWRSGKNLTVTFDEAEFRYYRLYITASDNGRIALNRIDFAHTFSLNGASQYAPGNKMFSYKGDWRTEVTLSSFGHVYAGRKNASAEFEFEGTRVAVLSSKRFGSAFEVYIDGKRVNSISLKEDDKDTAVTFISPELNEGKHKVRIKCTGNASIDSILVW